MFEQPPKEETLSIIKAIESNSATSQRHLSKILGISLGKTNYLVKELIKKGFVKVKNFSHRSGKIQKIHYILTKEGFEQKMHLTHHFLKKKEEEYNLIKKDWETLNKDATAVVAAQETLGASMDLEEAKEQV